MILGLEQQDRLIRQRWPFRTVSLGEHFGLWRGEIFGLSAPYEISILYVRRHFQPGFEYAHSWFPQVRVRAPLVCRRPETPDVPIPHVYDEGLTAYPSLCLFDPVLKGWSSECAIASTTIPWAADWLRFYEAWQATGIWSGGGREHRIAFHQPIDPLLIPTAAKVDRAARLIGTAASRALLVEATAGADIPRPPPRWCWADVPSTEWLERRPRPARIHNERSKQRAAA